MPHPKLGIHLTVGTGMYYTFMHHVHGPQLCFRHVYNDVVSAVRVQQFDFIIVEHLPCLRNHKSNCNESQRAKTYETRPTWLTKTYRKSSARLVLASRHCVQSTWNRCCVRCMRYPCASSCRTHLKNHNANKTREIDTTTYLILF